METEINKAILDHYKGEPRPRRIGHYNISELNTCYRQWFYRYKYPEEPDNETQLIFNMGHMLHSFVDEVLDKSPDFKVITNEKGLLMADMQEDFVLHGRVDNIVEYNNEQFVLDTKSIKSLEYVDKYPINEAYVMQLNCYMKFFGVKKGGLLYIENGTINTKFKEILYDEEHIKLAFKRASTIHGFLTTDQLPYKEAKLDKSKNWACRFCQYEDRCKKED